MNLFLLNLCTTHTSLVRNNVNHGNGCDTMSGHCLMFTSKVKSYQFDRGYDSLISPFLGEYIAARQLVVSEWHRQPLGPGTSWSLQCQHLCCPWSPAIIKYIISAIKHHPVIMNLFMYRPRPCQNIYKLYHLFKHQTQIHSGRNGKLKLCSISSQLAKHVMCLYVGHFGQFPI